MDYNITLGKWQKRREKIRAEYATGKYSIRALAKKHGVTDARIFAILHENKKPKK